MRLLTENTAGTSGKYISISYKDILHPKPEETRTADEIITSMKEKLAKIGGEK